MCVNTLRYLCSVLVFNYVCTHDYYEDLHMPKPLFTSVPKSFELHGSKAKSDFDNYAKLIEKLIRPDNATAIYKVKVFVTKPSSKPYKKYLKKGQSKKYNVPLKKTSMKLSNFEVFLRKMAEESYRNSQKFDNYNIPTATTSRHHHITTRQTLTKYKPVHSKLNNYTKIIKPVRKRIITLT